MPFITQAATFHPCENKVVGTMEELTSQNKLNKFKILTAASYSFHTFYLFICLGIFDGDVNTKRLFIERMTLYSLLHCTVIIRFEFASVCVVYLAVLLSNFCGIHCLICVCCLTISSSIYLLLF